MPEPEDQLRRYAEAAEAATRPTPSPTSNADTEPIRDATTGARWPRRSWAVAAAAVVALLVGVAGLAVVLDDSDPDDRVVAGDGDGDGPAGPAEPADLPFGLERCPAEPVRPTAAPEHYRPEPVYVFNEPVEQVRRWAEGKPGFEGLWIDRDHNGWITVAFSEAAEARQAELPEELPGVGVVAVQVDWTQAELEQLWDDVFEALQDSGVLQGGTADVTTGRVEVWVGELNEENLAPLAPFAGPRLCVTGVEPSDVIPDVPQPTDGDGWRLLGHDRTGLSYRTGIATTDQQYAALWDLSGLDSDRPAVDFEFEVVIWFGAVYGSGCENRMDDVVVDSEAGLVHGEFVIPGVHQACNDDANPKAFVVALRRDRLPEGPFAIQLNATDPPAGVPEERTVVDVDLRSPGSVATDDEIGFDPDLVDAVDRGYVVSAGGFAEPGFPAIYDLDLSCAFDVLGPFNGVTWQSVAGTLRADPPPAWVVAADDGVLEVELFMEESPARLSVTANGHTERYEPTSTATSTCP